MAEQLAVAAKARRERGKNAARRLRAAGQIPAVVYGRGSEALSLAVDPRQIQEILHSPGGYNTLFDLKVEGKSTGQAMLRDWVYEPLRGNLLHVDILRIAAGTRLKVKVPVHLEGEPKGVKLDGGVLDFVLREVEVECLPKDIPDEMRVNVSHLGLGAGVSCRGTAVCLRSQTDHRRRLRDRSRHGAARRRRGGSGGRGGSCGRSGGTRVDSQAEGCRGG